MRINTIHRSARFTRVGLVFVAILGGCDTPGDFGQGTSDDSQIEQFEAPEPEAEPGAVIPASPEAFAATDGVASWNIYDDEVVRVVGVDADGRAIVELQFQVDQDDSGALLGVAVQMNAPDGGRVTFDASGQLLENTLDEAQGRLLAALVADIEAVEASSELEPRFWKCAAASALVVGVCGAAVLGCLKTLGLGCAFGGARCTAAALNWLCVCMGEAC